MKTVAVAKRDPHYEEAPVEPVCVLMSTNLPDLDSAVKSPEDHIRGWKSFYAAEARRIADALWDALPGGTVDALVVEMLDRARSVLKVGHR